MAVSPQQKFDCAVKVIKSLPKNGSFQPSNEMMLRFYSYYKQAVEGPCNIQQPGFWDMVGRAKWKAWHDLGDMSKETAMSSYVEELKQIIETMPQTQMVADFMSTLGDFYEMVEEKMPFSNDSSPSKSKTSLEDETKEELEYPDSSLSHSTVIDQHLDMNMLTNGDVVHDVDNSDKDQQVEDTEEDKEDEEDKEESDEEKEEKEAGDDVSKDVNEVQQKISESDTESEEFCDTSDEPVPQTSGKHQLEEETVNSSTPICNKVTNRVRFSETQTVHLASGNFSPINKPPVSAHGVAALTADRVLSDSLFVNTSLRDAGNTSATSQLDFSSESLDLSSSYCEAGGALDRGAQGRRGGASILTRGGERGVNRGGQRGLFCDEEDDWERGGHDVNKQITAALLRLQQDVHSALDRLESLESVAKQPVKQKKPSWWLFENCSTKTIIFLITWPFVAQFIVSLLFRRKRTPHR